MGVAVKSRQLPTKSPTLETERFLGWATLLPLQLQRESLATTAVTQLPEDTQSPKTGEFSPCLHGNGSPLLTSPDLKILFGMSDVDIR